MAAARDRTDGAIGVGFLIPFMERDAVEAAGRVAGVVEFFWGQPDAELVRLAKRHGAAVGWQCGSASEAAAAATAGCDFVVAQGTEAGGHVRGRLRLQDALAEIRNLVDVPVVAAGGIGSAERVAELLRSGAAAVRIGTRFIAARESNAHPEYVEALIAARARDTTLTEAFEQDWPDAPHRVLRSALDAAQRFAGPVGCNGRRARDTTPQQHSADHRRRGRRPSDGTVCRYLGRSRLLARTGIRDRGRPDLGSPLTRRGGQLHESARAERPSDETWARAATSGAGQGFRRA